MTEENKALREEIAELRRANEILKAAAIFLGAELDGPGDSDREHRRTQGPAGGPDGGAGLRWGVEPMCAVLSEHGVLISPSTYY